MEGGVVCCKNVKGKMFVYYEILLSDPHCSYLFAGSFSHIGLAFFPKSTSNCPPRSLS